MIKVSIGLEKEKKTKQIKILAIQDLLHFYVTLFLPFSLFFKVFIVEFKNKIEGDNNKKRMIYKETNDFDFNYV